MSSIIGGNPVLTEGLIFAIDNFSSRSMSGTTPLNMIGNRSAPTTSGTVAIEEGMIRFNGVDTHVSFPESYVLNGSPQDIDCSGTGGGPEVFTIEAWIKLKANPAGDTSSGMQVIGSNDALGLGLQIMRSGGFNKVNFGYRTNSNDYCASGCDLLVDQWWHILGTRGPDAGLAVFVNGVETYRSAYSATDMDIDCTSANLEMGRTALRITGWFNGFMPIIRIYKKELTNAEVLANYNAERERFGL